MMRTMLLVLVTVALLLGTMAAQAATPAVQVMAAGPVYVAPIKAGTPFIGGLLTLKLPATWGAWTQFVYPAAIIKTGGIVGTSALCPALAIPVKISNAPVAFVGVTYAGAGVHAAVFGGIDLVALLGIT